jgi:hypothetical protein
VRNKFLLFISHPVCDAFVVATKDIRSTHPPFSGLPEIHHQDPQRQRVPFPMAANPTEPQKPSVSSAGLVWRHWKIEKRTYFIRTQGEITFIDEKTPFKVTSTLSYINL